MLYVRKLFTQDLRDGKQIAFPKEPSLSFFSFDYANKEEDRYITFFFRAAFEEFTVYEGAVIKTRLYAASSEARMDGEVKAFIRDKLNAKVGDLLIFKNKGTKHTEYEVMFLPQTNPSYPSILKLGNGDNHSVCFYDTISPIILDKNLPLQQIYYGAPGTGKSYEIDQLTKVHGAIRTTFHPDSDYSSFVGAYKPMMEEIDAQVVPVVVAGGITLDTNKGTYKEKRITYKFVKQAFLKAYLSAWKKYAEGDENGIAPQFLVIEEINRGNCAQIFGDLFQLLDRQDNGFSSYPIEADADLQREIAEAFKAEKDYMLTKELNLQGVVKDYVGNLAEDVKSGKILLLPSNFYIWATMNTSDQSLFPIDSAFKRRWEWHYVKIADAKKGWTITCGDEYCDWNTFIIAINQKIASETSSDDKKLGYFFCKPKQGETSICIERFVGKVMFYLWNDVFKDGDTSDFRINDDEEIATFEAFYNNDNTVNVANVRHFLVKIVGENGLRKVNENGYGENSNEDIEEGDGDGKDHTKYAINREGRISKRKIAVELVKKYIDKNPTLSAKEVADKWKVLGSEIKIGYIIETQEDYNNDTRNTKDRRLEKIICNGEPLWVGTHGWGTIETMNALKAALLKRNWGLSISEIQE